MNPYVIGGVGLLIVIMGWQLKSSNTITITDLEGRMSAMVEERRIESEQREQVLIARSKELAAAHIRAAELERIRDDEEAQNEDCADFADLSVDMLCPATAHQLRQRSIGEGGNGNPDS